MGIAIVCGWRSVLYHSRLGWALTWAALTYATNGHDGHLCFELTQTARDEVFGSPVPWVGENAPEIGRIPQAAR